MSEPLLTRAKQVALKAMVDTEAKKVAKRLKAGRGLQTACVFMAATFVDDQGNIHVIAGGQTPEPTADFYRRLMVMHARANVLDEERPGEAI